MTPVPGGRQVSADPRLWDRREVRVAGPGSNRSRAKARRAAKRRGNQRDRRKKLDALRAELRDFASIESIVIH